MGGMVGEGGRRIVARIFITKFIRLPAGHKLQQIPQREIKKYNMLTGLTQKIRI
jgi:hypothetical protein